MQHHNNYAGTPISLPLTTAALQELRLRTTESLRIHFDFCQPAATKTAVSSKSTSLRREMNSMSFQQSCWQYGSYFMVKHCSYITLNFMTIELKITTIWTFTPRQHNLFHFPKKKTFFPTIIYHQLKRWWEKSESSPLWFIWKAKSIISTQNACLLAFTTSPFTIVFRKREINDLHCHPELYLTNYWPFDFFDVWCPLCLEDYRHSSLCNERNASFALFIHFAHQWKGSFGRFHCNISRTS